MAEIITQTVISDNRIALTAPKIGVVYLSKFSPEFDGGLYAQRPWHVVTFGRNFATVEECVAFIQTIVDKWDDADDERGESASDSRNQRMIDCGYDAYAREEGHFS